MTEPLSKEEFAEVRFACGRSYLSVAGVAVAMEGDRCRDGDMPDEVYPPIPQDELERASIGGQSCKDMDPKVVRFFRGDNWTTEMLEYVAKRINDHLESAHAEAKRELEILREAAKDFASDIYALPPEERENEHIYRKARHLFELCDENGKTKFVFWFEDRVEKEKKLESTTRLLAVAVAALQAEWKLRYAWARDEAYECLSHGAIRQTFCQEHGITEADFAALRIGESEA